MINIFEVVEHRNLNIENIVSCSDESYYQCLATRFASLAFGNVTKIDSNNKSCTFKELCTPFSLPFKDRNIPICQTDRDRHCFESVLLDLHKDQIRNCLRLCRTKEFTTGKEIHLPLQSICQDSRILNFAGFIFEYRFKEQRYSRGR